jgi:hypothetical protein
MITSFQILSGSSFTYHPFIQCYVVLVTEKALLNKLQINTYIFISIMSAIETLASVIHLFIPPYLAVFPYNRYKRVDTQK